MEKEERASGPNTIEYKIGAIFGEIKNKIHSGYNLREIVDQIDALRFRSQSEKGHHGARLPQKKDEAGTRPSGRILPQAKNRRRYRRKGWCEMGKRLFLVILLAAGVAWACEPAGERSEDDDDGSSDSDGDTDGDTDGDADCEPGELWCLDTTWVVQCNDSGGWDIIEDCSEQDLLCAAGECVDTSYACAVAINEKSYIGCEYYAVTLANGVDASFAFAVAIANAGSEATTIEITDGPGGIYNTTQTIPVGEMLVMNLQWKQGIKQPGTFVDSQWFTRKVANATYRITSDRPVTAYQFSPLTYQSGSIFSYTNDASLLLPVHVYRDEYIAISRPTLKVDGMGSDPGYLAVVGPAAGPSTVEITTSAYTTASDATSNAVFQAQNPGGTFQVTVQPYEVFQLLSATEAGCTGGVTCADSYTCCNTPATYDLTGTEIRVVSGRNPAVFSGTDCSFIPFNKWACDHLEQQMFPRETWGMRYVCGRNETQAAGEPTIWRVLSGTDGNQIEFNPAVHATVTLDRGEFVEFECMSDFVVEGTGRVAVAQFMVGQNYTSDWSPPENGDPAMALAVPVEQYRRNYTFLTPDTYVKNYLTAIHHVGIYPTLDGSPLLGQGYTVDIDGEWAKSNLEIPSGIHYIESPEPFAIMVYGVGSYTSYMYPGGLDLSKVSTVVE